MARSNHLFRILPAFRSAVFPSLLFALSACTPGESAAPAARAATPVAPAKTTTPAAPTVNDRLGALIQATGITCTDAKAANGCTAGNVDSGDFYDVELSPDCGDEGFFAGVAQAKGVDVLNVVPTTGSRATTNASLAQGQLVCIQAIGRAGQNPLYYYVAAIPADTIAKCKNNALCKTYGDRPIKQMKPASGESCHAAAPGQYVGNCAQGWVSADALDVFSNGL
ncbi:hypothetical protein [Xanthomonas vesicatoria]|uniref:hypothetical protein n=1 Tax=Xanthomonas vesicatoria TaxID=56460 RepID=UPI000938229F|nr:hypothetical protein [Xanthomonas vesicatoria]APP76316.1 hypothetical protein BJD12_14985 [Xanthomonas vesicatoria ATCC 35937]MCC8557637.1 hypothetical protein [Xanthomonas vesicatoria]MCC8598896.1 hypothetical protein [Xanthomonas vesicatoria]MCC8599962.1 hypothetical protein [Xanthomonas vesicatoria]MCC8606902.1 hypothetical protein [Xanthomonas vesicatoria]